MEDLGFRTYDFSAAPLPVLSKRSASKGLSCEVPNVVEGSKHSKSKASNLKYLAKRGHCCY